MRETKFRPRRMNDVLKGLGDNGDIFASVGDSADMPADVQLDAPTPPSILDVMPDGVLDPVTGQPAEPVDYQGGTGLLDPMTGEPIPYTQVIATNTPPDDPIAAGIDVNAIVKTATGVYYQYKQTRDAMGRTSYVAQQVQAPRSVAGGINLGSAGKFLPLAILAYILLG